MKTDRHLTCFVELLFQIYQTCHPPYPTNEYAFSFQSFFLFRIRHFECSIEINQIHYEPELIKSLFNHSITDLTLCMSFIYTLLIFFYKFR